MDDKPEWTDAKFKVISDPNRLPWWRGWRVSIDPMTFLICAISSAVAAIGFVARSHP